MTAAITEACASRRGQAPRRVHRAARHRPRRSSRASSSRCWGRPARARRRRCASSPAWRRSSGGRVLIDGAGRHPPRAGRARRGDGVPELRALSAHDGGREHRLSAEDGRHAGRPRSRGRCGAAAPGRHRPPARTAGRASSPAASSSAARWRARSCASRACSCSTSRCPTSTPSCASRRGRAAQAAALARRDHRLRDARPGRGDDGRRPHGRLHGRPDRAGRHAERHLPQPAHDAVAAFIGTPPMNLLPAHMAWPTPSRSPATPAGGAGHAERRDVTLGVRPGDLRLADCRHAGARRVRRGPRRQRASSTCRRRASALKLTTDRRPRRARRRGTCTCRFEPEAAHLFDRASGQRL